MTQAADSGLYAGCGLVTVGLTWFMVSPGVVTCIFIRSAVAIPLFLLKRSNLAAWVSITWTVTLRCTASAPGWASNCPARWRAVYRIGTGNGVYTAKAGLPGTHTMQ